MLVSGKLTLKEEKQDTYLCGHVVESLDSTETRGFVSNCPISRPEVESVKELQVLSSFSWPSEALVAGARMTPGKTPSWTRTKQVEVGRGPNLGTYMAMYP